MKRIAIIPARAGSKGLPNKNVLMLGNKPLIAYTIEAALESKKFDKVIVSTDSLEYKYIAEKFGAEVIIRDPELSNDTASSFVVIEDVLKKVEEIDYFVLLQVTSPFRDYRHINECVDLFEKNYNDYDFLVSMQKSDKPSFLIKSIEDGNLGKYNLDLSNYSRQKYVEYHPNGAIYIGKKAEYLLQKHFLGNRSLPYIMSKEDSVDIDDELDFEYALTIFNKKNKEKNINEIEKRIFEKEKNFTLKEDIVLIGDSILDNWKIEKFNEKTINNLAISKITTEQYINFILKKNKIKYISDYIILMLGASDILYPNLENIDIVKNLECLIKYIREINKNIKIFFIEIPTVAFRIDRKKEKIYALNLLIKNNLKTYINFIEINKYLSDEFGNLKLEYTNDGFHFSENGYLELKKILKKEIDL